LSTPPADPPQPETTEPESQGEPRGRRTHSERREEAETRILAAAVKIVTERGLQDVTLAECGQAAGYSRGLAAHYFGSRDELIGSIARYIVGRYSKSLRTTGPPSKQDRKDRRGLEGLLDRVHFYIKHNRDIPHDTRAFHVVLGAAFNPSPLSDAIAELNRKSVTAYAGFIREGIEAGEIRPDVDPMLQASLLLASIRGVVSQWLVDPTLDLDLASKEFINNLRRSLAR
jgi:AcrR family transcriptional regulator